MADFSTFLFTANTLDGKILEFPLPVNMRCDLVVPLYQDIVRDYDKDFCIVARKVYLVSYGGHVYGTLDFTTMQQFVDYRNVSCGLQQGCCFITFNGCYITFNGQKIVN